MKDYERGLTLETLQSIISYNPETGHFYWKSMRKGFVCLDGKRAGGIEANGYVVININNVAYKAHRLAWFYTHGVWPNNQIDHINRIRTDNRINNLREATQMENSRNAKAKSINTSGFKGVSWHKEWRRWMATICVAGKAKFLGYYPTAELASDAYRRAAAELFGEFALLENA